MSQKRYDSRGRVLRNGESQRKDGRYMFKYNDLSGKACYIYSSRLEAHDRLLSGSKRDLSLREKEEQIQQSIRDGLTTGAEWTVYELVDRYVATKMGVRMTTKTGYKTVLRFLEKQDFGKMKIKQVKRSDAKLWLIKLQDTDKKSYSTIHTIRGVVRPAFQMAVQDDILKKNPFDFELATVVVNDSKTRDAISRKQERLFLQFIKNSEHYSQYYDAVYILFHTGLRISELCGLTEKHIDFKNNKIRVRNQLIRGSDMVLHMEPPKTDAGIRDIPMSQAVRDCFERIIANRDNSYCPVVDGYKGFLFIDMNGNPTVAMHWEHYFSRMVHRYNDIYKEELPNITPHVCRHTFCSNMAKSGMNPKALQYIMGHTDISVTLNTYTHLTYDDAQEEFRKVAEL